MRLAHPHQLRQAAGRQLAIGTRPDLIVDELIRQGHPRDLSVDAVNAEVNARKDPAYRRRDLTVRTCFHRLWGAPDTPAA